MSILIIDDDPAVRDTLGDILAVNGYRFSFAANGAEGFAQAKHSTPNLIITDILMPVMDGYALLEACRRDPRLQTVPIIITSARDGRGDIRRAMELGASDYISKPFTEVEVIRSVAARLEKKELLDELDSFVHTAAHDLRHPLSTLGARLELATQAVQQQNQATALLSLAEAALSAEQLGRVIDELLLLSGVRRQLVYAHPLDMAVLVSEARDRLAHLLQRTEAQIELPDSWPQVVGHGNWVTHVWVNLLSNAASYAGPAAQISLGGAVKPDGKHARFWVQDRGPGLTPEAQEQMFMPFTDLSKLRARGHGLGLSIVRRIVEKLGGTVGVDSRPGGGACFWFELPTSASPPPRAPFVPVCVF